MTHELSGPELAAELKDLRARLAEAEEVLRAIRSGNADAVLVTGDRGGRVYTLSGADHAYRQLVETINEGAVTLSADGVILYCNDRLAKMLERPLDQVMGSALRNYLPPADQKALGAILARARTEPSRQEINLKTSEGRLVPTYLSASLLHSEVAEMVFCLVLTDLTAQRRHEEVVAAEQLARLILEQAAEAIVVCDKQGRVIRASQASQRFCEGSPLLQPFVEVFPLRTNASDPFHLAPVLQGETLRNMDVSLERQGHKLDLILNAGPLLSGQQILGCVVTLTDITERKRTEGALRRQALTFENIYDAVVVVDEDYKITDWNPAATRMFGYEKTEALGRHVSCLHQPEVAERQMLSIESGIESAGRWEGEYAFVRKDGTRGIAEIVIVVFRNAGGTPVGTVGVSRDITERKRAERRLQESEEKYRDLVENASYGIYRSTVEGELLDVNPAFVSMLGYDSKEELLQVNLETSIYQNPAERKRILSDYETGRPRVHAETNFKRKDGTLIRIRIDGRGVCDVDKKILYHEVIAEDVTQQRNLEQQFRQAQKMEAVGRLAGGVAHDFNNLLMIICSYASMIPEHITDGGKVESYAKQIVDASARAAGVVRQLLAFSRKQVMEISILDLNVLVLGTCKMLQRLVGEDIEMSVVPAATAKVRADRSQLEQVIMNMAVNARDAMPQGGKLTIETANVSLDGEFATRHGADVPTGNYVMLAVSDTGMGMDAETQAHIFEPFFTTKEPSKGTGLGLAMVYGVVKQSGGFVWLYSELGKGTAFKIYLPQVETLPTPGYASGTAENLRGGSETILVVEDELALRAVICESLRSWGYTVLEVANGLEALDILRDRSRAIHLLVTDIVMPGLGGPELAKTGTELRPDLLVVYMSGYTDRTVDQTLIGSHAIFVQKPISLSALAVKIRRLLDDGADQT